MALVCIGHDPMPTGWKLQVRRGDRVEYFIARTADRRSAISAVRRRPGMKDAIIGALGEASRICRSLACETERPAAWRFTCGRDLSSGDHRVPADPTLLGPFALHAGGLQTSLFVSVTREAFGSRPKAGSFSSEIEVQ
jgi:hypothetical protein